MNPASPIRPKTVLITGAAGNLGGKLRRHLNGRYNLRLLDLNPGGDPAIRYADIASWEPEWVDSFAGVDAVVHLAADPTAHQTWPKLIGPNVDGTIHVYQAAIRAGVRRVVYASSNHVMGGYKDDPDAVPLTTSLPPRPGARYIVGKESRDSTPYGTTKLFGERLGKCHADIHDISVVAIRIGWVRPGENAAAQIPMERGSWFRQMWLSNRDFCNLMERATVAELPEKFVVVNGMSANTGMPWDIDYTRQILGYSPSDDVTRPDATISK